MKIQTRCQFFKVLALLVLGIPAVMVFSATTAAQQLEEIIVEAQKRAESLQDVSVSVTALSGDKLIDNGVARLEEVTAFVPNFTLSETGIGTNIYIRGIGSGINQGFEQSVGMYFDGVYYARAQLTRSPIFDLERVEVLRGPQVTLFGNNSIGGAVSLVSAKPTDQFESSFGFMLDKDHGEREITAMASGPLFDGLNARLAVRKYDMDGYIKNAFLDTDEPSRDYLTSRLTLDFTPDNDVFNMLLKLERSDFNVEGRQIAILRDGKTNYQGTIDRAFVARNSLAKGTISKLDFSGPFPALVNFTLPVPNLTELFASAARNTPANQPLDPIFKSIGGASVLFPEDLTTRGANGDASDNEINNVTLTTTFYLPQGDLKSITAFLGYEYEELCDCDFTAADLLQYESSEEYEQYSQELRYTSTLGESGFMDYIIGGYYQKESLDFDDFVKVVGGTALEETLKVMFDDDPALAADLVGVSVPREFDVDSELFAIFGQTTLHFTEYTRLILGVRESKTQKSGFRELRFLDEDLVSELPQAQYDRVKSAYSIALKVNPHRHSGRRKEKRTSWSAIVEQDISDDYMVYLSAVRGFKGGGFDARSNKPESLGALTDADGSFLFDGLASLASVPLFTPGTFDYEDEEAMAYEAGIKASLGGRAEINLAYFYTEIENLQLSVFDGGVGFNVSNAGKAVTQGVEVDWRLALTDAWSLNGSLAWMDFEYKDYKDGLCTSKDLLALTDTPTTPELTVPENCKFIDVPVPGSTGIAKQPQADLTGETNQYVANYSGALSVSYENYLFENYFLRGSVDVNFTDEYNPSQNLDPDLQQSKYETFNLRLGISNADDTWEVALLGRNITDREIVSYANDVPLAASVFGTQTSYGFVQRTRSWALQARLKLD